MPDSIDADLILEQLERILRSPRLESSPSLSDLLKYVVTETLEGRGAALKEYSLGVAVFERGDAFDPRLDPIVRVQARNLRSRLADYYTGPGAEDLVLIDLPKRTYAPVFQMREPAVAAPPEPAALPVPFPDLPPAALPVPAPPSGKRRPWWTVAVAACLLLMLFGLAGWLVWPRAVRTADHQPDSVALDLYIRARQLMDRLSETEIRAAIDTFEEAVRHDPQFAAAHAGIAEAFNVLAQFGYLPPAEGMQAARQAAQTALSLQPRLAEGHVALAAVLEAYDWNWSGAEREYRRAIDLSPSLAAAHLWYGMFLRDQGRIAEALPELRLAARLEPYSVLTSVNLAYGLMAEGNYPGAAQQARQAVRMAPSFVTAHVILANALSAQSLNQEAEAALNQAFEAAGEDPLGVATLARAFAWRGRKDETRALSERLDALARKRYVSPYDLGTVFLALGDEARALEQLQEAYRQRSSGLIFLRTAKFAKSIRDPQLWSLIEKMGITG